MSIAVSIVLYKTSFSEVETLVNTLRQNELVGNIYLLDNSPEPNQQFDALDATYLFNGQNIGYGRAHNIALRKSLAAGVPFHLVVNADICFSPTILTEIVNFMHKNTKIGLLMPKILYPDGKIQYLCKLLPTPIDLFGRRFLPSAVMRKRMERFEMRSSQYDHIMEVPYLSGCFMMLRTEALQKVGLFDERFFMYPEDVDLTRRVHKYYQTVFYPNVSVVHAHAQGSYKSYKLLWIHIVNMIRYFNKWGWIFDKERRQINKQL